MKYKLEAARLLLDLAFPTTDISYAFRLMVLSATWSLCILTAVDGDTSPTSLSSTSSTTANIQNVSRSQTEKSEGHVSECKCLVVSMKNVTCEILVVAF